MGSIHCHRIPKMQDTLGAESPRCGTQEREVLPKTPSVVCPSRKEGDPFMGK